MKKILSLVGARPQFIKEALVGQVAREAGKWHHIVVHSGQHYDALLSDVFFSELSIPTPKHHLEIGSGSHASMTAAALVGMERVLLQEKPDALLVYGDTNTTLAGAIAASKLGVPIVHIEAGIRMLPKTMPEEINRVLTDRVSSVFCCCSQCEADNLQREATGGSVCVTGDVMYDVFLAMRHRLEPDKLCGKYNLEKGKFVVATMHRDYNVDNKEVLENIIHNLLGISQFFKVIFIMHPRTRNRIESFGLQDKVAPFLCVEPESYLGLMSLVEACAFVITDSGGLQKEAYYAGKRAVVVMPDTGWRALVECGWNVLVSPEHNTFEDALAKMTASAQPECPSHIYGDGRASYRIIDAVGRFLQDQH